MKKAFYLFAALAAAISASAEPNRYELRSFPAGSVDLGPLFTWWEFASQTTNRPLDITAMNGDKLAMVSNLWLHLPPRPLPAWFRVMAREGNITETGTMWKVDAIIEPAATLRKEQLIYLRHPPVREIQDFKLARAAYLSLSDAQNTDLQAERMWQSNVQAEASAILVASAAQPPSVTNPVPTQTAKLDSDSVATVSNINNAQARTDSRIPELTQVGNYLAGFPDTNVYWVDHFAMRTGEEVDGLEVYDLGSAPGLTY